jgi:dihydroflavonol-4-reductase
MESGDRVLVTGASGFVGSAVLRALMGQGLVLRALARASSSRANFVGVDCEIAEGDMTSHEDMNRALKGVRWLIASGRAIRVKSSAPIWRGRKRSWRRP